MIMCKKYIVIIFVLPCVTENCYIAVNRLSNNKKNAPNPRHAVSGTNSIKRETDIFKQSLKFYSTDYLYLSSNVISKYIYFIHFLIQFLEIHLYIIITF